MTVESKNLSSLVMLILGIQQPEVAKVKILLRKDAVCPKCGLGELDYNGLLQLECPKCGFVSNEGGGCT